MGDYAVTCALSGLPIKEGMPVIGWKVKESPFGARNGDICFNPESIPVEGKYNAGGGIIAADGKGLGGDGMTAICHKELWDKQIKLFDHKDFAGEPCQYLRTHMKWVREKYLERLKQTKAMAESCKDGIDGDIGYWSRKTEPFEVAEDTFSSVKSSGGVHFLWYLDKFFLGVRGKIDTSKMKWEESSKISVEDSCGPFELLIYKLIIDGCPDETADMLEGMCKMYATEIFRNRPIMPSQMVRCVSYPEYQKEVKWLRTVNRLGTKLLNNENERRKENEADTRRILRKYRKEEKAKARSKAR